MENSYRYFENRECKYFPCHTCGGEHEKPEYFNCLFCFCPLYTREHCPGNYTFIEKDGKRIKSCLDCTFPHIPENYEIIMKILKN